MIRTLLAAVALLFAASPLRAEEKEQDKEKPADVPVEILISEDDKVLARAALHMDLADGNRFQGKTAIRTPEGFTWTVFVRGYLGRRDQGEDSELVMQVNDTHQLQQSIFQGSTSVYSLELFDVNRAWRGPGTYRMAEHGKWVLFLKVADTPALQKAEEKRAADSKAEKK